MRLADFFTAPVRFLKESLSKESEFEKPYLDGSYPDMQFNMPTPDWGRGGRKINLGGLDNELGFGSLIPDDLSKPYTLVKFGSCDIQCTVGLCTETVKCWIDAICYGGGWVPGDWSVYVHEGKVLNKGDLKQGGLATLYFNVDPTLPEHYVIVGNKNSWMNVPIELICCDCDTGVNPFTFDNASSPDTIAQSSSATVYVSGGCPPYTWSIAGSGFTLTNAVTQTIDNSVVTDAAACGSATITITDGCGSSASGYILCTTGGWVGCQQSNLDNCVNAGACTDCSGTNVSGTAIDIKHRINPGLLTYCCNKTCCLPCSLPAEMTCASDGFTFYPSTWCGANGYAACAGGTWNLGEWTC